MILVYDPAEWNAFFKSNCNDDDLSFCKNLFGDNLCVFSFSLQIECSVNKKFLSIFQKENKFEEIFHKLVEFQFFQIAQNEIVFLILKLNDNLSREDVNSFDIH